MKATVSYIMLPLLAVALTGCISVAEKVDTKTGIKVQTVGVVGCGNPSQRFTSIQRPGEKATGWHPSTGTDPCNTLIAAAAQVAASAVLPRGGGISNVVQSGSSSVAEQSWK